MEPKFLLTAQLGKLVKWIRVLGYDALVVEETEDDAVFQQAADETRAILTKSVALYRRRATFPAVPVVLVEADTLRHQFRQIARRFNLVADPRPFTRCLSCNTLLQSIAQADVVGRVPDFVLEHHAQFQSCPSCSRIYWAGTHWERMRSELQLLLAE